jgi:hypothetical protein
LYLFRVVYKKFRTPMFKQKFNNTMGEGRGAYMILVERHEGRRPFGRPRRRREDNIKVDFQKVGWGAWTGLI